MLHPSHNSTVSRLSMRRRTSHWWSPWGRTLARLYPSLTAWGSVPCMVNDYTPILAPENQGVVRLDLNDLRNCWAGTTVEHVCGPTLHIDKISHAILLRLWPIRTNYGVPIPQPVLGVRGGQILHGHGYLVLECLSTLCHALHPCLLVSEMVRLMPKCPTSPTSK